MQWISRWLKPSETADVDALKSQLHSEGFGAYQWKGTPGAAYLDYIHTQEEVVCVLFRLVGMCRWEMSADRSKPEIV